MLKMRNIVIVTVCAALVAVNSCSPFNDAHEMKIEELAWNSASVDVVSVDGGEVTIPVYSNGTVYLNLVNEADWVHVSTFVIEGDGKVVVAVQKNAGRRRMVKLAMELEGTELKDTVEIRQEGIKAYLEASAPYKAVSGQEAENIRFQLKTNLPQNELNYKLEYLEGSEGWLESLLVEDYTPSTSFFSMTSKVNPTSDVRKAKVVLSHLDGWENMHSCEFYITQARSNGNFGTMVDFASVRQMGSTEGRVISEDLLIDGIVISDYRSRNMDENTNVSYDVVDSLSALRTVYIMSEDGAYGFRLKFDSHEENVLQQGTKLQLNLNGTVLTKEENPERYTISKINGRHMVSSAIGSAVDIPVKNRTIATLTDADVYTYVNLLDTEFIFKYGSFADVYENYTLKSSISSVNSGNNDRMDGWATLLVDSEGSSIYAPVNMHCLWRRDGRGVPQGVGTTAGIIVHNKLPKVGNVGKYQIRVLDKKGFAQASAGSSYEEFCIWNGENKYGNDFKDYSSKNERYAYNKNLTVIPSNDIMKSNKPLANGELFLENNVQRGGGDTPLRTADYYCSHVADDRGISSKYSALCAVMDVKGWYQWNGSEVVGYNGFRFELNTKDLEGTGMLFNYDITAGTVSITYSKTFPAHWCVEYSVDGGATFNLVNDYVSGNEYVHMRSLPWWDSTINGTLYKTCAAAGLGFSQHAVLLPAEVLGLDKLIVRLRPYDKVLTSLPITWDGDSETTLIQSSTTSANYVKIGSAKFSVKK